MNHVLEFPCVLQQDIELPSGCQLMRHRYGTKDDLIRLLIVGGDRKRMIRVRMFLYYQVDGPRFVRLTFEDKHYAIPA